MEDTQITKVKPYFDAYQEGRKAKANNQTLEDNPYTPDTLKYRCWDAGWKYINIPGEIYSL